MKVDILTLNSPPSFTNTLLTPTLPILGLDIAILTKFIFFMLIRYSKSDSKLLASAFKKLTMLKFISYSNTITSYLTNFVGFAFFS
jgi:hypothetical protein